jgi:hypothetical protein
VVKAFRMNSGTISIATPSRKRRTSQPSSAVVEHNTAATEEMSAQAGGVDLAVQGIAQVSESQSGAMEQIAECNGGEELRTSRPILKQGTRA